MKKQAPKLLNSDSFKNSMAEGKGQLHEVKLMTSVPVKSSKSKKTPRQNRKSVTKTVVYKNNDITRFQNELSELRRIITSTTVGKTTDSMANFMFEVLKLNREIISELVQENKEGDQRLAMTVSRIDELADKIGEMNNHLAELVVIFKEAAENHNAPAGAPQSSDSGGGFTNLLSGKMDRLLEQNGRLLDTLGRLAQDLKKVVVTRQSGFVGRPLIPRPAPGPLPPPSFGGQ